MRLFIAINFDKDEKDSLMSAIGELKSAAEAGRFTNRENLHLTLVFLGEVGPKRLGDIKKAMASVPSHSFPLSFGGLGRFNREGGDIYWLGVEKSQELAALYEALYQSLTKAGFRPESRSYRPHLTLGRQVSLPGGPRKLEGKMPSFTKEVKSISLMESSRINNKLTYTKLHEQALED